MATSIATTSYPFDDRNIHWYKLGDFEHFVFAMLDVDEPKKIVDLILKFEPNKQIFLHRHLALTNTLVVQGEHRLYEPDGALKEFAPSVVTHRALRQTRIERAAEIKVPWSFTVFAERTAVYSKCSMII